MPVISGGVVNTDGYPAWAFSGAGAPAANFAAGICRIGSIYINSTSGSVYSCTATNNVSTSTWTAIGAQTAGS